MLTFAYLTLRHSLQGPIEQVLGHLIPDGHLAPSCYLVGHLTITRGISTVFTISLCSSLIGWEITRHLSDFKLDSFYFLLMSKRDLRRYYNWLSKKVYGARRLEGRDTRLAFFNKFMSIKIGQQDARHTTGLRLKPHRGLADRERLQFVCNLMDFIVNLDIAIFMPSLFLIAIFSLSNDADYVYRYPGCDVELEQLVAKEKDSSFFYYSFHLRHHKLLTIPIDLLFNTIFWTYSWYLCVHGFMLALLMECDVYFYWLHAHNRAKEFDALLDSRLELESTQLFGQEELYMTGKKSNSSKISLQDFSFGRCGRSSDETSEVRSLKEEFIDLFLEVGKLNAYAADGISAVVICVALLLSGYGYSLEASKQHATLSVTIIISFALFLFSLLFVSALALNHELRLSLPLLCSIMAKSKAPNKCQLNLVVNLYIDGKSSLCLFRMLPINTSLSMRIVSLSISVFLVINSMSRQA